MKGLSQGWNPIQLMERADCDRTALREFLTLEATRGQYVYGVQDETLVAPEAYTLDSALLARPGNELRSGRSVSGCEQCSTSQVQEYLLNEAATAAGGLGQR